MSEVTVYPSLRALREDLYDDNVTSEVIEASFKRWSSKIQYLLFEKQLFHSPKRLFACKASKRGNDVYAYRVRRKLEEFKRPFEKEKEAKPVVWQGKTNVLYVTDTFDAKLCDFKTAWYILGPEFNRQIANLRYKYGRIHIARTFESFENGYPHIHFVAIFLDHDFDVELKYSAKEKKRVYRVANFERNKIASSWFSFVDIQGMKDVSEGLSYCFKYAVKASDLSKDDASGKGFKTQSRLWAFGKRSYSLGVKFREAIFEKYLSLDLTRESAIQRVSEQMTLEHVCYRDTLPYFLKIMFEKCVFKGIISKTRLKRHGGIPVNTWHFGLTEAQSEYALWVLNGVRPERISCIFESALKNPFKAMGYDFVKRCPVKYQAKARSDYEGFEDCTV